MNRESVELGFILKQIPDYDFSMNGFPDRLKLQKTIYLLQVFGVYLGYDFSWYLRGPYCSILATNGFLLQNVYDEIPEYDQVRFKNKDARKNFKKFLKFVTGKNVDELEIASSLHYLKQVCTLSDDKIREKVTNKRLEFTSEQVDKVWGELKSWKMI